MRNRINRRFTKVLLWCCFVLPTVCSVGEGWQEFDFRDIGATSGLNFTNTSGKPGRKDYILESTGCGVAVFDYDRDGKSDLFFVNASRLEPFPSGEEPTSYLYRNLGDGRFADVTRKAGLVRSGWGQGVCVGDYNNDGYEDLFLTYYGADVLYRNNGDGTFLDATAGAGLPVSGTRWGTGAAFLDYDRDGRLDLFVANYVDFDLKRTPQRGEKEFCTWRGVPVFCGPRGLPGGANVLYHGQADGTFVDVTSEAGILTPKGYYAFGVVVSDFDNDGFPDIYVACDSTPNILYRNKGDGTFKDTAVLSGVAYNADGNLQAGMGVTAADYDNDGHLDLFKTNFSEDLSTLYHNDGRGLFSDVTLRTGIAKNNKFLGWGTAFGDFDNDGWKDIAVANGHIYPEADQVGGNMAYAQPMLLYRNLGKGRLIDVSKRAGPGFEEKRLARGLALGDLDNDGNLEIVVNNLNQPPALLRQSRARGNSILIQTVGTQSNRDGIGARVSITANGLTQMDEVRSGGSYLSHGDLRLHFGVGDSTKIDILKITWPSRREEVVSAVPVNHLIILKEGAGVSEKVPLSRP